MTDNPSPSDIRQEDVREEIHRVLTYYFYTGEPGEHDAIETATDVLAALSEPVAWREIESAPKDGTPIELWHNTWNCPVSARYRRNGAFCWTEVTLTTQWPMEAFTHWRPASPSPDTAPSPLKLGSSEPLGPRYDGTTMDNQQLHGTTRRNQTVVTAGETAPHSPSPLSTGDVRLPFVSFEWMGGNGHKEEYAVIRADDWRSYLAALSQPPATRVPVTDGTTSEGDVITYEMDTVTGVGTVLSHTREQPPATEQISERIKVPLPAGIDDTPSIRAKMQSSLIEATAKGVRNLAQGDEKSSTLDTARGATEQIRREVKALEQIAVVCTDNMDRSCNHRMALDFVRQVANAALAATEQARSHEGKPTDHSAEQGGHWSDHPVQGAPTASRSEDG